MSKDSLKSSECTCKCGYRFCFDCGYESHLPASCELVKKFIVDAKVSSVRPKLGTDCQSVWEKFEKCNKKVQILLKYFSPTFFLNELLFNRTVMTVCFVVATLAVAD